MLPAQIIPWPEVLGQHGPVHPVLHLLSVPKLQLGLQLGRTGTRHPIFAADLELPS